MDSLSALGAFVRVAEARNFTDAGRLLSLSSSAVGKMVARLEARLGVRLFHRSTRSMTLTQEGKLFLESCRRIFAEIEAVELEFAQTKGMPKGVLRVSLPLVGTLLMPILSQFMRRYPDVHLDVDFTDHIVDVIEGGYDVVVRTGDAIDSRLIARTLGHYRLQVVGAPDYFARAGIPTNPDELVGHACLHHKYPTSGRLQRWPFIKSPRGSEPALPVSAASSTVEPLISLAESGVGLACVPDFAIRQQIASGSLIAILDDCIDHRGTFRAMWPTSRYLSPKVRAFVDFLVEHMFQSAGETLDQPTAAV